MQLYGSQGNHFKCAGGCGGMKKTEDDESMVCSHGCTYLCGPCSERQKSSKDTTEVEVNCPFNHNMQRFPPSPNRDKTGEAWCCNFPLQGKCVGGVGGDEYGDHQDFDVWRCTEDSRVKRGGQCNLDLCGLCVSSMGAKAKARVRSYLAESGGAASEEQASLGKLTHKVHISPIAL